jgi:hypothetical protein
VRNRKPGAVSRPGAVLEFQFRKYTDLAGGVNNAVDASCPVLDIEWRDFRHSWPLESESGLEGVYSPFISSAYCCCATELM